VLARPAGPTPTDRGRFGFEGDLDPNRLEYAGSSGHEARRDQDAAGLFRDGPFDFVGICTRPDSHSAQRDPSTKPRRWII
jgi:hypothetical protein